MTYRLLVVAGENPDLQDLKQHLGDGVTIAQVSSANEALWEVRSTPPHAIVADMILPDMSGLDLAEILPNFGVATRVVLLSHADDQMARQQANEFGVYRFLGGVIAPDQLRDEIFEALRQGLEDEQQAVVPEPEPEPEPAPTPTRRTIVDEPAAGRVVRPPTAEERAEQASPRPATSQSPPSRPAHRRPTHDLGKPYEPPDRSRRPVAPDPAERSGGLAARARQQMQSSQAAPETPAAVTPPPVTPPPAPPASDTSGFKQRGAGTLVLTSDNLANVNRILSDLSQMLGAQCALLTDRAGMTMAQHGSTDKLPMMILLPLLSTSFSTAGEVGRQLREEDATTLYIHDGTRYALYCFDIVQRFLLVVVFDKQIAATKIGSVWVEGRGAIRKLRDALK